MSMSRRTARGADDAGRPAPPPGRRRDAARPPPPPRSRAWRRLLLLAAALVVGANFWISVALTAADAGGGSGGAVEASPAGGERGRGASPKKRTEDKEGKNQNTKAKDKEKGTKNDKLAPVADPPIRLTHRAVAGPPDALTCREIQRSEIVRRLGQGGKKAAFEIRLPSGDHALAKRCMVKWCQRRQDLENEIAHLRGLRAQYGPGRALEFLGECRAATFFKKDIGQHATNFSTGLTYVTELGRPLLEFAQGDEAAPPRRAWDKVGFVWFRLPDRVDHAKAQDPRRKCFASYLTAADVEDFKVSTTCE